MTFLDTESGEYLNHNKHTCLIEDIPQTVAKDKYQRRYAHKIFVPSNGYLYDDKFPGGEMIISPMTAAEERILASQKTDKVSIVDQICKRCIIECPIPYDDLLISDAFYIFMCIRNVTYGTNYDFTLTCPMCGTKYARTLAMPDDLIVTGLSAEDDVEPYSVELPKSGDTISFSLLRNRDEAQIRRYATNQYSKTVDIGDPAYCMRLATYIQDINNEKIDMVSKLEYVESMHSQDSVVLRNAIESREFGISLILNSECPNCGVYTEGRLPFDKEFFRPSNTSGRH